MSSNAKSTIVKITAVAPEYNRCLTFVTSHGTITVKVLGPDDAEAAADRDNLFRGLVTAGLRPAEPPVKKGKAVQG